MLGVLFFFSSRRRHTRCALVTGVQTCALPISAPVRPTDFHKQVWRRTAQRAGLSRIPTVHEARHVAASLMIENGDSPAVVQATLGHKTSTFTMAVYVHVRSEGRRVGKELVRKD